MRTHEWDGFGEGIRDGYDGLIDQGIVAAVED